MTVRILHGDCRDLLATLSADSIDACVTDPPYDLTAGRKGGTGQASYNMRTPAGRARIGAGGFMGQKWDATGVAFDPATWLAMLRVLKPGAHLVAFGGSRTYHRLVCAIEDAGFEIRDQLAWLYGNGFPKGTDKAKIPEAARGWNTALKPAHEPIVLARKPMVGTLAENLERYGTGALWINGCRIEWAGDEDEAEAKTKNRHADFGSGPRDNKVFGADNRARGESGNYEATGRWPANLLHDGSAEVLAAFPQTTTNPGTLRSLSPRSANVGYGPDRQPGTPLSVGSSGSAARFFYCSKATTSDRGPGNTHPTVKPTDVMRWLCRLVTPPRALVANPVLVDPFMGSGSTLKAAELEGFSAIGMELEADYIAMARSRIGSDAPLFAEVAA